ncbi:hemerythrin domain-containing protein, partial [Candidatus Methylomirabilis sp.]|uniref:hemerythrin domain-containing protein n=1 Tax=Candidatus Methylomirabilis sp. TaxID=2032687 RepID=UPI003C738E34
YYTFAAERAGEFDWRYLETGPEVWQVEIRRVGAAAGQHAPSEGHSCGGHHEHHDHHTHQHAHTGSPTQILKDEHTLILEALDGLERKLAALEAGATPDRAYFEKAVRFIRTFADQCHHGKEEDLLFKTMVDRGFPLQGGPIAVMLSEHEAGRGYIREMAEASASVGQDKAAAEKIIRNGRAYIQMLRPHIDKENMILYAMADNMLSPEDQAQMGKAFERFETEKIGADVHEAMMTLQAELKAGA